MSVAVFVVPILILAALALGVLVYYICYKAVINRKLRAEESGAHVPMASMESVWKVVAVIAVFVMYSSLSSKITNLQNELNHVRSNLSNEINEVESKLYEMQEAAKKEASMISEVTYDFGKINTEEHTAEMIFCVVPKCYSAGTELSLNYRGKTVKLTNNGAGIFTGSTVLPIFEEYYENSVFCITEGGETKTEVWEDLPQDGLQYYCLPVFHTMQCSTGFQKKKDSVRVNIELRMLTKGDGYLEQFRDATLYVKKDNTVIDEITLVGGALVLDKRYPAKDGENFDFYMRAVDQYGYIHEQYVTGWSMSEGRVAEVVYEETVYPFRVYAPDGTVIEH
ncbi:MAG: hypothetical protein IJ006_03695 [Lachnospiraceae bacterium]|nr:hypothetical protein [Lachnospiraceae bacterium]